MTLDCAANMVKPLCFNICRARFLYGLKTPGFRVIVEKFANAFWGKIGFSHDAPLLLIGQRPLSVTSTAAASSF